MAGGFLATVPPGKPFQAVLHLKGAVESTNSTNIPRVLALCHPLGIEMVCAMVPDLEVECRLVGIKFEDRYIIYVLQHSNNNKANLL